MDESGGAPWGDEGRAARAPQDPSGKTYPRGTSIPRLPVRSGPGGEDDRNGATQTVGPEFVGERTARWRTAAGEIAGREGAKRPTTRAFR